MRLTEQWRSEGGCGGAVPYPIGRHL